MSYAGSAAAAASTTTTTNLTLSTKKPRPLVVDQLWQHVFCQFGVADYGVLTAFSSVVCRVEEGVWGVGLKGVATTSGNGTAAEASAYPLVEGTMEFLREFVVDDNRLKDLKEKGNANANANVNGKVSSASGSGLSSRMSTSRGERERERGDSVYDASGGGTVGRGEDKDEDTELFLPTYDTMKAKKRLSIGGWLSSRFILFLVSSSFRFHVASFFPFLWCWRRSRPLVLTNLLVIFVRISNDRTKLEFITSKVPQ